MRRFKLKERVFVRRAANGLVVNASGVVARLRSVDYGAWIQLDARHPEDEVHPFPADTPDERRTHVLAWPEDCDWERLRLVRGEGG
jgi:hypothetical protein